MKKSLLICTVILSVMAMVICGCGSTKQAEKSTEETYADEDFMKDLAAGLKARWSIEEPEYTEGDDTHKDYYTKLVDAEYDKVSPYLDKKFKDSTLQQKAMKMKFTFSTDKNFDKISVEKAEWSEMQE